MVSFNLFFDMQCFNTETSSVQVILHPKLNEVSFLKLESQ